MRHTQLYERENKRSSKDYQSSLPLKDLKKRSSAWYKKGGIVTPGRRKRKTIEYIVERSYEALPKELKKEIIGNDKNMLVTNLVQQIMVMGKQGQINPYKALLGYAEHEKNKNYGGTLEQVFKEFKVQAHSTYNHYNTYVYRQGQSAREWFFKNANVEINGKVATISIELPKLKPMGKKYSELYIEYDYSGGEILSAGMIPYTELDFHL